MIYGEAVKEGVFPSIWQRPLMMEKGLTALPWWSADKMGYFNDLTRIEKKMDVITRWMLWRGAGGGAGGGAGLRGGGRSERMEKRSK